MSLIHVNPKVGNRIVNLLSQSDIHVLVKTCIESYIGMVTDTLDESGRLIYMRQEATLFNPDKGNIAMLTVRDIGRSFWIWIDTPEVINHRIEAVMENDRASRN